MNDASEHKDKPICPCCGVPLRRCDLCKYLVCPTTHDYWECRTDCELLDYTEYVFEYVWQYDVHAAWPGGSEETWTS